MNVRFHPLFRLTLFVALLPCVLHGFVATSTEPVHCLLPAPIIRDGSSTLFIGGTESSGRWAYDGEENKVAFGEQYGTITAKDMITGLATPADGSLAKKYLTAGDDYIGDATTLRFNSANNSYTFRSVHLGFTQHIISSLFIQCHAHLVEQEIKLAPTSDQSSANITAFLNDFDALLAEYDLPAMTSNKRPYTLERFFIFAGWGQHTTLVNSVFQEIGGTMSAGYVVTPPAFEHPLAPAALPYNINDGFIARITGHAQIAKYIDAQVDASSTIYNERNGTMRVVQDDTEGASFFSGPLLLGTGFVKKNPGTLLTLQMTLGVNRLYGFYANAGYQFSYQEKTNLKRKDTTTLTGMDATPALQEIRLNTDPKLNKWKHHAITFGIGYEPTSTNHRFLPRIEGRISFPLWGSRSINSGQVYSGQGRLALQWLW